MRRALGKRSPIRCAGGFDLLGKCGLQHGARALVHVRIDDRGGLFPPGKAAKIGLANRKIARGQVRACEGLPCEAAMPGGWLGLVPARQTGHDRCGFFVQSEKPAAVQTRLRLGHRDAAPGKVVHQLDVERQLRRCEDFKDREDKFASRRIEKKIAVFDSGGYPAQRDEVAQRIVGEQRAGVFFADGGKYGHVGIGTR